MGHITINDQTPRVVYAVGGTPQGVTIPFIVPFEFFSFADLQVFVGGVLATLSGSPALSTEYAVIGTLVDGGYEGGQINLGLDVTNTTVIIGRKTPIARTTDFPYPSPNLNIKELNTQLDILFALLQQISLQNDRTLHLADNDPTGSIVLPDAATRANQLLGFDNAGNPTPAQPTGALVSAAMQPVVAAATLAAAIALLFPAGILFSSADPSAVAGPFIDLDRASPSPAVSDLLGMQRFFGRNSSAAQKLYASAFAFIRDPVAGTEDGAFGIQTIINGVIADRLYVGQGLWTPNVQGGDKGADTISAKVLYAGGAPVAGPGATLCRFEPLDNEPPSTAFAQIAFRNGHPTLQFDTTTQWAAVFTGVMPAFYGNLTGITVLVTWSAASAVAGTIGWTAELERMDPATDIDADSFATAQTITAATVPATSGFPKTTSVAIAKGANMDSVVAGDTFRLRIKRDVANDTAAGNAEILSVEIRET